MSDMRVMPCRYETNVHMVAQSVAQGMMGQGYAVMVQGMNENSVMMTVSKDADGFKNVMGMGVECHVTMTKFNNSLNITIDSEWTNKIIACAIGWLFCLIPLITGIVGCVSQSELPGKIFTMISANLC